MTVRGAAWRLGVFAAVMGVVLSLVLTAIERPVSGTTEAHDALFTDANGLKVGDDVRMYGVQVGKVEGISLAGDRAKVRLTVTTSTPIYDNSKLAIRYQNLTGQRYIDLQQQPNPGARIPADNTIGTELTVPSFDVTSLFNGLKPVLATLSPESVNKFTESMLAVIEGDGMGAAGGGADGVGGYSGLGPAMEAIGTLSKYVGDRQQVIGTLVRNMSDIADRVGGRVHYLVPLLARLSDIFQSLQANIGGLAEFAMTAPSVLGPIDRLLGALGITPESGPDIDALIRRLFPDPQEAVEVFGKLPGLLTAMDAALPQNASGWKPECSKGKADVPQALGLLIAGQQVAICKG